MKVEVDQPKVAQFRVVKVDLQDLLDFVDVVLHMRMRTLVLMASPWL